MSFPEPWTDLEEAIIWLTIRAFKAEHIFLRRHFLLSRHEHLPGRYQSVASIMGFSTSCASQMSKRSSRYINEHIGQLPRANGKSPFGFVPISKIQRTLAIAGIGKVRGRPRTDAA